jgi:heme-degrading monooxygenase HmoA
MERTKQPEIHGLCHGTPGLIPFVKPGRQMNVRIGRPVPGLLKQALCHAGSKTVSLGNSQKITATMILQTVTFSSGLDEEELLRIAHERAQQFRALPGLLQKYYVKGDEPGQYKGVYIWESPEALEEFRRSDLAASIPKAYKALAPPRVERLEILFPLRD